MEFVLEQQRLRTEALAQARAINDKANAENRAFTDDEQTAYGKAIAEAKACQERADRHVELNGLEAETRAHYEGAGNRDNQYGNTEKTVRLGEFCMAVRNAQVNPGGEIPNYLREQRSILGQSETVPTEGGFLLQTETDAGIGKNIWSEGELLRRCQHRTLNGNTLVMNQIKETSRADGSRFGGIRAYWEAEGDSTTASKLSLEQKNLSLNKLFAVVYSTDELLADVTQLESEIVNTVPKELRFKAEDGIINGLGAGQMHGILASGALQSITKESGQAADTVVTENILKMWKSRFGTNLTWFYNQELEDQLELLKVEVGTGGEMARLFVPPQNPGAEATIKGRPAYAIEQASGPGDVGDIMLLSLDDYVIGEKVGGIQMASSIHVQFLTDQNCWRFIWRIAGQPLRSSKITPYKRTSSSFYLTPFNTIAAR